MSISIKVGVLAVALSIFIAVVVLLNTDNGRMAQGGVLGELVAFIMFVYAAQKGSRWWLTGPVTVILFWITAAHIDFLWK